MGGCVSQSKNGQQQAGQDGKGLTAVNTQRRRLSVSQSAEAAGDDDEGRGSTLVLPLEKEENVLQLFQDSSSSGRRMSVAGKLSQSMQRGFDNKKLEKSGDLAKFVDFGIGFACKKGLKPESPNQDDFFIFRIDDWGLYGVFDGHGPCGHDVASFVQHNISKLICSDKKFSSDPAAVLRSSFLKVNRMLEAAAASGKFDCTLSGSTATVLLHVPRENKIYVAHVGDSRCVMGRASDGKTKAVDLTNDHKPNLDAEKKRIVASGGQVRRLEGDIPYRVFVKGKLYPGLAMSRALGDTVGVSAGVIPDPDVSVHELEEGRDLFFIMCSDGVWEFMTSQEAVDVVVKRGQSQVQDSAETLASESWKRWIREEGNIVDDITVQVVYLFPKICTASGNANGSTTASSLEPRHRADSSVSSVL